MVKIQKKWNRQRKKSFESSLSSSKNFKVSRVPIKKRKLKHPGFTLIQNSLYGFFENDHNLKRG